jgi:tyrosyl-tRNA synthetase
MSISAFHGGLEFSEPLLASVQSGALGQRDINEFFNPRPSTLSLEERYELCSSVGEEVLMPEELRSLLERKQMFRCYDGFEPSGRMHIAQGIMKALNVNKITKAGGIFIFWVADWFALLNNKMDGDLEKIRVVGRYFVEVWKAAGMDLANV